MLFFVTQLYSWPTKCTREEAKLFSWIFFNDSVWGHLDLPSFHPVKKRLCCFLFTIIFNEWLSFSVMLEIDWKNDMWFPHVSWPPLFLGSHGYTPSLLSLSFLLQANIYTMVYTLHHAPVTYMLSHTFWKLHLILPL